MREVISFKVNVTGVLTGKGLEALQGGILSIFINNKDNFFLNGVKKKVSGDRKVKDIIN